MNLNSTLKILMTYKNDFHAPGKTSISSLSNVPSCAETKEDLRSIVRGLFSKRNNWQQ